MEREILAALAKKTYAPVKPKALARKLGIPDQQFAHFRNVLRELIKKGKVTYGRNHPLRAAATAGTIAGIFRRTSSGRAFVRPHLADGRGDGSRAHGLARTFFFVAGAAAFFPTSE